MPMVSERVFKAQTDWLQGSPLADLLGIESFAVVERAFTFGPSPIHEDRCDLHDGSDAQPQRSSTRSGAVAGSC